MARSRTPFVNAIRASGLRMMTTRQAPEKAHRNLCASWRAPTFTPTKVGVWPANEPCCRSNLRMSLVRQQIAAGLNAKGHKVSHVAVGRLLKDRAHPASAWLLD